MITLTWFNRFSTVVVSLRFFAKCKFLPRPSGRILQADKSRDCILQTRIWEYEISRGCTGKRGAIQLRNSCIKDTKNLPFVYGKKKREKYKEESKKRGENGKFARMPVYVTSSSSFFFSSSSFLLLLLAICTWFQKVSWLKRRIVLIPSRMQIVLESPRDFYERMKRKNKAMDG